MSLEKSCPETLQTQGNKEKSERSGVDTLTKRKLLIEHYEFCIDILVIINADDKLLIKEMSKNVQKRQQSTEIIHYYCPLALSFIAHRPQRKKKEKGRKEKKMCLVIIKTIQSYNFSWFL